MSKSPRFNLKIIFLSLVLNLFFGLLLTPYANAGESSFPKVKDVFLKGSHDGEKMWLVLGFENAAKISKGLIKESTDMSSLKSIWDEVHNDEHDDDLYDDLGDALEFSTDVAPHIFKGPWKSISRIPNSFKVSFSRGKEAYHNADNIVTGAASYLGHALWANVKGGYYLVVEAPTRALLNTFSTIGAIPFVVSMKIASITIKLTYQVAHTVGHLVAAALTAAYSGISTTIAYAVKMSKASVVAIYNGLKFVVAAPISLFRPVYYKIKTELDRDKIAALASHMKIYLKDKFFGLGIVGEEISIKGRKYNKSLIIRVGKKVVAKIKLVSTRKKVKIKSYIGLSHYKKLRNSLKQEGMETSEIKSLLKSELEFLVIGALNSFI